MWINCCVNLILQIQALQFLQWISLPVAQHSSTLKHNIRKAYYMNQYLETKLKIQKSQNFCLPRNSFM